MTKNQQIWLAIVAIVALFLYYQKKNNPYGIIPNLSDPKNQLPLKETTFQAGDVFDSVISMQGQSISTGY